MVDQKTTRGRVLIADDDEAFRTATTAFLRRQGFDCESARDSSTATEKLRDADFELLISDINMPGNAGLEFVEKLPEIAAALPVILLTGHPSVQSAARSVRLRVAAYLVKPCDAEELLTLSEQAIANYRAYFDEVYGLLKPNGLFLNHGITRNHYWEKTPQWDFLVEHVFPNGELDTVSHIASVMEEARFEIADVESLRAVSPCQQ